MIILPTSQQLFLNFLTYYIEPNPWPSIQWWEFLQSESFRNQRMKWKDQPCCIWLPLPATYSPPNKNPLTYLACSSCKLKSNKVRQHNFFVRNKIRSTKRRCVYMLGTRPYLLAFVSKTTLCVLTSYSISTSIDEEHPRGGKHSISLWFHFLTTRFLMIEQITIL